MDINRRRAIINAAREWAQSKNPGPWQVAWFKSIEPEITPADRDLARDLHRRAYEVELELLRYPTWDFVRQSLDFLEQFNRTQREAYGQNYKNQSAALQALAQRALTWAKAVDITRAPDTMEEAVVRAAACVFRYAAADQGSGWIYEVCVYPTGDRRGDGQWRICWESGPPDWGVYDTDVVPERYRTGDGWFTEPYYSFDLRFVEDR